MVGDNTNHIKNKKAASSARMQRGLQRSVLVLTPLYYFVLYFPYHKQKSPPNCRGLLFYSCSTYCFKRGSMASVKPSPIRLKVVTVINMAKPGKMANHQACGIWRA